LPADKYLYKDLPMHDGVKKPAILGKLFKALAFQIYSKMSCIELRYIMRADIQTVEKYIDLLEKAFIVFHLPVSRNNKDLNRSKKRPIVCTLRK